MVFFYGVLIGIAVWEVKKSQESSDKLKSEIKQLHLSSKEALDVTAMLQGKVEEL